MQSMATISSGSPWRKKCSRCMSPWPSRMCPPRTRATSRSAVLGEEAGLGRAGRLEEGPGQAGVHEGLELVEVLGGERRHRLRAAEAVDPLAGGAGGVEGGDAPGEAAEQRRGEVPAGEAGGEAVGVREADHLHRVVGGGAALGPGAGPQEAHGVPVPEGVAHPPVDAGGEAAVQAHLVLAGPSPDGGLGEVEEGELHRLLQLEHRVAGEEEPGDVGLHHPVHDASLEGGRGAHDPPTGKLAIAAPVSRPWQYGGHRG